MGRNPNEAEKARAISVYRRGYSQKEICHHSQRIFGRAVAASTIGNWIRAGKEADFDLEIEHLLASRHWKPGLYTNWAKQGSVLIGPSVSRLTNTLYLGDFDYIPLNPEDMNGLKVQRNRRRRRKLRDGTPQRESFDDALSGVIVTFRDLHGWTFQKITSYLHKNASNIGVVERPEDIERVRSISRTKVFRIYHRYSAVQHKKKSGGGLVKELSIVSTGEIKLGAVTDEHR